MADFGSDFGPCLRAGMIFVVSWPSQVSTAANFDDFSAAGSGTFDGAGEALGNRRVSFRLAAATSSGVMGCAAAGGSATGTSGRDGVGATNGFLVEPNFGNRCRLRIR